MTGKPTYVLLVKFGISKKPTRKTPAVLVVPLWYYLENQHNFSRRNYIYPHTPKIV